MQSASHASPCTCVITSVEKKKVQVLPICGYCVTLEGSAAHTINLCKKGYNERRLKQGEEEVAASNWRALVEQKAFCGKLPAAFGLEQLLLSMWERFTIKKSVRQIDLGRCRKSEAIRSGRQVATRNAVQGGGRAFAAQHSPALRRCANAPSALCGEVMRLTKLFGQFLRNGKLRGWRRARVRECYNKVEQEEEDRQSIAQDILRKSTEFMRRSIVPVEGQGGVALSYVCPHCHLFPLEDHIWWISFGHGQKQCNWWCAACGGQYDWRAPNRVLVMQDSTYLLKSFERTLHRKGCVKT